MVDGMICGMRIMRLSSFPHFWRFFCWSRLPLWWSYTGWWLLISFNVKVSLPIPGTVPQGLGLRCFRQSPCPDFDVFEHLITHPMNVDLKWLGIGEWPQLVGGFKYTIVLCPTIEIGWTSPIMIFEIRFFFVGRLKPPSSQLTNYCSRCRSQDHGHIGGPCLCKALCRRPGAGENFLWHFRGNWTENMFHNILHMLSHVMNVLLRMH